jgi:hypothetical protein
MVMQNNEYETSDKAQPDVVAEPVVAYRSEATAASAVSSDGWNPNVPFHGTQDEWWEHFHKIEEGEFMSLEDFHKKIDTLWERKYAAKMSR